MLENYINMLELMSAAEGACQLQNGTVCPGLMFANPYFQKRKVLGSPVCLP
jgi:hypothetical protein